MIAGLVLAAGGGQRFGGPKQLADLDGLPLLEHAVRAVEGVPAIRRVVVMLGAHAEEIVARVDFGGAETLVCGAWAEGQAASLRCGVAALADDAEAVLVTLGDQPLVTPQVIAGLLDAADGRPEGAVRVTYGGVPGHPVLLRRALFGAIARLRGDVGARDLLKTIPVRRWEAGHLARPDDVDTPEELEAMRR